MNFLIIRFSSIGDVVLTTSLIKNIKINDNNAQIDILTKPEYSKIFANNPDVRDVLFKPTIKKSYDVILDVHNNLRSNLYKFIFRAKKRLTYNKSAYARRMYVRLKKNSRDLEKTVIDRYLEPLGEIEFRTEYIAPALFPQDSDLASIRHLLPETAYVTISPGATWPTKKWSVENYIALSVKIIRELGMDVVILGSKSEFDMSESIRKGVGTLKKHVHNIAGETDLMQLAACLKESQLLVTPDSGPLHVAWAVGTKTVALFGPTVKEFGFQPVDDNISIVEKDMNCRPCSLHGSEKCKYGDKACMNRIEVHDVMDAAKELL